jgi:hypothetical protein
MLFPSAWRAASEPRARTLPRVKPPSAARKAPTATVTVGTMRNTARKLRNGSSGSRLPHEVRRPVPVAGVAPATGAGVARSVRATVS